MKFRNFVLIVFAFLQIVWVHAQREISDSCYRYEWYRNTFMAFQGKSEEVDYGVMVYAFASDTFPFIKEFRLCSGEKFSPDSFNLKRGYFITHQLELQYPELRDITCKNLQCKDQSELGIKFEGTVRRFLLSLELGVTIDSLKTYLSSQGKKKLTDKKLYEMQLFASKYCRRSYPQVMIGIYSGVRKAHVTLYDFELGLIRTDLFISCNPDGDLLFDNLEYVDNIEFLEALYWKERDSTSYKNVDGELILMDDVFPPGPPPPPPPPPGINRNGRSSGKNIVPDSSGKSTKGPEKDD